MTLLEPVSATLQGAFTFREVPAPVFVLGAIAVFISVVLIGQNWSGAFQFDCRQGRSTLSRVFCWE
jgi:drug/metabolite transporter (DMT)-like permease